MSEWINDSVDGTSILVKVVPKASKSEIVGVEGDCLKIRLKAPPVDGAANKELINMLGKLLKVPKKDIIIKQGHASKRKRVYIVGVGSKEVQKQLAE